MEEKAPRCLTGHGPTPTAGPPGCQGPRRPQPGQPHFCPQNSQVCMCTWAHTPHCRTDRELPGLGEPRAHPGCHTSLQSNRPPAPPCSCPCAQERHLGGRAPGCLVTPGAGAATSGMLLAGLPLQAPAAHGAHCLVRPAGGRADGLQQSRGWGHPQGTAGTDGRFRSRLPWPPPPGAAGLLPAHEP